MSKFKDDATKIYAITFNQYTNALNDTVSDGADIGKTEYIHCDKGGTLLIRENEFDYYRKFGGGIRTMNYIGIMYEK